MNRVNQVLTLLSGILILLFMLLANLQVFYRYVLQLPLPWVEEVARYIMVLMVFIMSGVAIFKRSHLSVELIDIILKGKALMYFDKFRLVLIAMFSICFTILSFKFIMGVIESGQVTPALRISMSIPISALLVGGMVMTVNSLYLLFFGRDPNEEGNAQLGGVK